MEVVYAKTRHPMAKGRTFQNPRHFAGPLEGATKVFIDGNYPDIARAYTKANVPVIKLGAGGGVDTASAEAAGETVHKSDLIAELRSLGVEPEARATKAQLEEQLAAVKGGQA